MAWLIDPNVLLRYAQPTSAHHNAAVLTVKALLLSGDRLCIAPQNLMEFWNVATRPLDRNGLGFTWAQAQYHLDAFERIFDLVPGRPEIYGIWKRLVLEHSVTGVQVHDTHLVAVMQANDISHLLTFNATDFTRFASTGITVVIPSESFA